MVQNAGRLWYEMDELNHRQRLQRALFPEGLSYGQSEGFGTAANTYPVRIVQEFSADASRMAPHTLCGSNTLQVWLRRAYLFELGVRAAAC